MKSHNARINNRSGGADLERQGGQFDNQSAYQPQLNEEKKLLMGQHPQAQFNQRQYYRIKLRIANGLTLLLLPAILLFGTCIYISMKGSASTGAIPAAPTGSSFPSGFDMKKSWGSFSPYFDTGAHYPGLDAPKPGTGLNGLPPQCTFKQVHVLHRHAERYPTPGMKNGMEKVGIKLKDMTQEPSEEFNWVKHWKFTLGSDLLVVAGTATEYTSGASFWATHGRHLFNATQKGHLFYDPKLNVYDNGTARPIPVLRATTQSRIKTSAEAWAAGFFGLYGDDPARSPGFTFKSDVYKLVLQVEKPGINNTLAGYFSCPNSKNSSYVTGSKRMSEWVQVYMQDAATRLQTLLPGYQNLTAVDAFYMQQLCAHETAAYGSSPFCSFFTEEEWIGFEYSHDLNFFGMASYGSAVGAAEGAGWLYELQARLEQKLISVPQNGVNSSFTSSEDVFPLDQRMYLDMSHDSVIVSVLTALGLTTFKGDLPSRHLRDNRQFVISRMTPFGARLFVEILSCEGDESLKVRLKLNNRVLPLTGLKYCPFDKDGLCAYDNFVDSIKYALEQIDFDSACYGVPINWN